MIVGYVVTISSGVAGAGPVTSIGETTLTSAGSTMTSSSDSKMTSEAMASAVNVSGVNVVGSSDTRIDVENCEERSFIVSCCVNIPAVNNVGMTTAARVGPVADAAAAVPSPRL